VADLFLPGITASGGGEKGSGKEVVVVEMGMIGIFIREWRVIKGKKENQDKSNKKRDTEDKF
jgi:hypothetical protein